MIGIIDYGMGNLRSVANAFRYLGAGVAILTRAEECGGVSGLVLPGVGAFGDGMDNLRHRGFLEALEVEVRRRGKPFLGICLGMQLLATVGFEYGRNPGLGWVPGEVDRLPGGSGAPAVRVPHIGWNDVRFLRCDGMYAGFSEPKAFYFVHSYKLVPGRAEVVNGLCEHGVEFPASIEMENIWATQYHPEKSHRPGLAVLKNFVRRVGPC
jgi:glutamine amidotransferase